MTPGDHNPPRPEGADVLPRTVPQDPQAIERERAVRRLQAELEKVRNSETPREAGRRIGREVLGHDPEMAGLVDALFTSQSDCHGFEPPQRPQIPNVDRMEVVNVQEGDVIVIHSEKLLPASAVRRIRAKLEEVFPGHKAVVLDKGMKLEIYRDEGRAPDGEPS